jgi:S-DNA-T family DNA segregation ATPase FtsK/SpoIIIE
VRLKFSYQRPQGGSVDLVAELEAQATVGQLASHLAQADPLHRGGPPDSGVLTLAVGQGRTQLLEADSLIGESPLASGSVVSLARATRSYGAGADRESAAAKIRVLAGPDAGREFLLGPGSAVIGREQGCEVRLSDAMVSRRHARVNIGDTVEIVDQGSANGIMIGLAVVQSATLGSGDLLTLGDTQLEITRLQHTPTGSGTVHFVRPARVVPVRVPGEFQAPTPPERRQSQRFPTIALVIPLIMGGVLFLTTHQLASIIFIALSPLMLIGNALESRFVSNREFKRAVEVFDSELTALVEDVRAELTLEAAARLVEHPSASACIDAATSHGELLWSRRPDLPGFAQLRLALGRAEARCTVERPQAARAPYDLLRRVDEALAGLRHVDDVPIVGDLGAGALGVAGPRVAALSTARALLTQVVGLHSPAELTVAGLFPADSVGDWDWLKWLPHSGSVHSPLTGRHLVATPDDASALVAGLEALLAERAESASDGSQAGRLLPRVLLVVESGAMVAHNRLVDVAERGPALGVHILWVASERTQLPAACKVFVEAGVASVSTGATDGRVGYVVAGEEVTPVLLEAVDESTALGMSRALAPVEDVGARNDDASDLPKSISQFATLADTSLGSRPESVIERWHASNSIVTGPYAPEPISRKAGSLRAVVGMTAAGPHALDLRTDGPHALVGGSTNAGKSELLQSWILSLAATHSPERVTFLLVDYKGGSAFGDCVALPHTIGLVTDLERHMVRRALTSLTAELRFREDLFNEHGAKDLIEMEKHGIVGAPPSLVIVVDEFAALVNEVPEFVDGVINVAARGRSLGLHLILATQQPSGVIRGSLRANTNLRLALRVTDEQDSLDVIGAPDAAGFDPSVPGRAMSRSGPTRLVAFQTAYAGGWTSDEPEPPQPRVEELTLTTSDAWALPETDAAPQDRESTDIKRLVSTISRAHALAELPTPRKVWMPVLPAAVDLAGLPRSRRDDQLVFALGDDPEHQSQPAIAFHPDREGNLAVYGTGGAGKSTLLRAIAVSAAFSQRRGPCHVYGLDFGTRALQMLEALPHVGSIVAGADHERVVRLITWLRQTIDERTVRYAAVNASTVTEYRLRAERPEEPRIILLVDNIGAFRQAYEVGSDRQKYVDMLTAIAGDGRPVGVHLVVSASERIAIHTTLSSAIQRRLVMRMAAEEDYAMLGVPMDVLDPHSAPGRAIDAELELQVGILGEHRDDASQAQRLDEMATALRATGAIEAPAIRSLPSRVHLASLLEVPHPRPGLVIGLESDGLVPATVDVRGGFLITGPPGSGRSTALRTALASLRHSQPGAELHYFGHRRSPLASEPGWASVSLTVDQITEQAQRLVDRLVATPGRPGQLVVVVENAGDLVMSAAEMTLQSLVKLCLAEEQWFLAEGEVSTVRTSSGFLGLVKSSRRGLALQPDQESGGALFNTPFPRTNRAEFPEGRGFLVAAGRADVVQVALAGEGATNG